jgi:hypothetical protein
MSVFLTNSLVPPAKICTSSTPHLRQLPDFHPMQNETECQLNFRVTKSCPKGRTTTVTLRCDPDQPGRGQVNLPSRCPDGTCDGCNFHFLWTSNSVCPICGQHDIKYAHLTFIPVTCFNSFYFDRVVKSECLAGEQIVHFLGPKTCIMPDDVPGSKKVPCSTHIPFVLQVSEASFWI